MHGYHLILIAIQLLVSCHLVIIVPYNANDGYKQSIILDWLARYSPNHATNHVKLFFLP